MSRVQLAINVSDLESSIAFYSNLLSVEPAKVREGYANFVVEDPPLKLVLIEQAGGVWERDCRRFEPPGGRGRNSGSGGHVSRPPVGTGHDD